MLQAQPQNRVTTCHKAYQSEIINKIRQNIWSSMDVKYYLKLQKYLRMIKMDYIDRQRAYSRETFPR